MSTLIHLRRAVVSGLLLCCLSSAAVAASQMLELPSVDIAAALAKDAAKPGPQAFRFAVPVPVNITPATDGVWSTDNEGQAVWQLAVHSAGASSLNFGFTEYHLPAGAVLRIVASAASGKAELGPFGPEHNTLGQLWTAVLRSDTATLELKLPASQRDALKLTLSTINHGFRGFGAKDGVTAKSGSCNIDVVCGDGDAWRNEIRSVARYTVAGALLCTGTLVNNSALDLKPYFLTANHCVTTPAEAPTTVFYWNYQTSKCGGTPDGSLEQTQSGALYLAGSGGATSVGSDFTLMQLLSTPSAAFKVYYSGWDARNIAPVGVTGIHHPNGDEKRISMDYDQLTVSAYGEQPGSMQSNLMPTHLMVASWDRGVTEGGSSGSGIWNKDHRLVGQLSGGSSACDAPKEPDWYGRMYANFTDRDTVLTSLRSWLDPKGGTEILDGLDPAAPAVVTPPTSGNGGGGTQLTTPVGSTGGSGNTAPASSPDNSSNSGGGGALGLGLGLLPLLAAVRRRQPSRQR